jgi:hypothetical protein
VNTRPLPPSCPTCRGEGALEADHGDATCHDCHGTGEAPASLRVGVVAVACIGAAVVGGFIPSGWWRSIDLREWAIGAVVVAAAVVAACRAARAGGAS